MRDAHQPSPLTARIAVTLFYRSLEKGKWPGRLEFTKYLYLLDWAHTKMKGVPATDVRWKFFHYGPWSEDLIPLMTGVQERFGMGWTDYTPEHAEVSWFEPVTDKLGLTLESLINRVLGAFAARDISVLIDFCYRLTEPMTHAKRGELLDFQTVEVTGQAPLFFAPVEKRAMPQLSERQMKGKERLRAQAAASQERYSMWKKLLENDAYKQAMARLSIESETEGVVLRDGAQAYLSTDAIDELDGLRNE